MKILVINGPNLNFLGIREKSVYGNQDYQYLLDMIADKAKECGSEITVFQSNHEGAIIDRIQEAYFDKTEGIVINTRITVMLSEMPLPASLCRRWKFIFRISLRGKNFAKFL